VRPAGVPPRLPLLWIDVISPYPAVARGLKDILETTLGSKVFTTLGPVDGEPDVILYDVIGLLRGDGADLDVWLKRTGAMVIAMTHDHRPDLGAVALERGCAGAVRLSVSPDDLVGVISAILSGAFPDNPIVRESVDATRLGYDAGLSTREGDVLRLIARGHSNQEISERLYVSVNSTKSYIRSAYRKIGVANRAQAVAWAIGNGVPSGREAS